MKMSAKKFAAMLHSFVEEGQGSEFGPESVSKPELVNRYSNGDSDYEFVLRFEGPFTGKKTLKIRVSEES